MYSSRGVTKRAAPPPVKNVGNLSLASASAAPQAHRHRAKQRKVAKVMAATTTTTTTATYQDAAGDASWPLAYSCTSGVSSEKNARSPPAPRNGRLSAVGARSSSDAYLLLPDVRPIADGTPSLSITQLCCYYFMVLSAVLCSNRTMGVWCDSHFAAKFEFCFSKQKKVIDFFSFYI